MTTRHTDVPAVTASTDALLRMVMELVREGGGRRAIVADGRTFVLSLTPAPLDQPTANADGANAVATQEADLLRIGDEDQRAILAHPDMLDLNAASALSGIPVRTLTHMRTANRLLALARAGARRGYRFPAFQFEPTVLAAMPTVLAAFGSTRAWQAFDFLTHAEPMLSDGVPIELLRSGQAADVERVLQAAASLNHGAY
ncbi:MAG: hypothetical protein JSR64_11975 [Nitrospira sp.]|nr:hypothetical protein [Nitrospira sp.]